GPWPARSRCPASGARRESGVSPTESSRRTPDPECPVHHPATGREPLDAASVSADSRPHRATRVALDLISTLPRSEDMGDEGRTGGVSLRGTTEVSELRSTASMAVRTSREGLLSTRWEGGTN